MAIPPDEIAPELSRRFPIARLGSRSKLELVRVVASPEECAAVAARFEVHELHTLVAICTLRRGVGDTVAVRGNFTADLSQRCVVSNEIFRQRLRADFATILHASAASLESASGLGGTDVVLAIGDADDAVDEDVLDDPDVLDVGELVAQYFYLNIDQFPRKPGATFDGYFESDPSRETGGFLLGDRWPSLPDELTGKN
jgi:hypothetical protein